MSAPTFAVKDAATILSEVLAAYKAATVSAENQEGIALQPADPRRLIIQTIVSYLAQHRAIIDHAGRQNLLRYVGAEYIEEFAALWQVTRIDAAPSTCTQRFYATVPSVIVIPAGKRVTDGVNLWRVPTTRTSAPGSSYLDVTVECTVNGAATNGIAIGQIDTLVDTIPGIATTSNTTSTISGRDIEDIEVFRERLRSEPEASSVAGPRLAYEALARAASASVSDVKALGPDDAGYMDGAPPSPGEVFVLVMEEGLDAPSGGLLATVDAYLSDEQRRPLGDSVIVKAPDFVTYDCNFTWYIARSREAFTVETTEAVEAAYEEYKTWQRKIGRDISAQELTRRLINAGAKRISFATSPGQVAIGRDQCSQMNPYDSITFGGVEDD